MVCYCCKQWVESWSGLASISPDHAIRYGLQWFYTCDSEHGQWKSLWLEAEDPWFWPSEPVLYGFLCADCESQQTQRGLTLDMTGSGSGLGQGCFIGPSVGHAQLAPWTVQEAEPFISRVKDRPLLCPFCVSGPYGQQPHVSWTGAGFSAGSWALKHVRDAHDRKFESRLLQLLVMQVPCLLYCLFVLLGESVTRSKMGIDAHLRFSSLRSGLNSLVTTGDLPRGCSCRSRVFTSNLF